MKTTRNILLILSLTTLLFTTLGVNADETETTITPLKEAKTLYKEHKEELKQNKIEMMEEMKENKEELKQNKTEMMEEMKENREELKQNIEDFREEHKGDAKEAFSELSDEIKEELKALRDEHKEAVDVIKKELKDTDLTLEEREELKEELNELNEAYGEDINELVSGNEKATDFLESRKKLKEANDALRDKAKEAREAFRESRGELINQYKENYLNRLTKIIPQVSDEKLEKVGGKIDAMIEKIEDNDKLSDDKKDTLLAQVTSLKEIFEEELESRGADIDEGDLDEIIDDIVD